jgi:hypothetical protein
MARITTHYGIAAPVPFCDVDVRVDNRSFIDPHAVRLHPDPLAFGPQAVHSLNTFFDTIRQCALSTPTSPEFRRGERLLQRFNEPIQTRLGMSQGSINGHGAAEKLGSEIWAALTGADLKALITLTVLKQLEHLPLFVQGIDRDITSDITTRIIFDPLARFTMSMVSRYPEFSSQGHLVKPFVGQMWDPNLCDWGEGTWDLPIADGRPLILVPTAWVRQNLLMSAGRFYETTLLTWVQLDGAVTTHDGRILMTTKDVLKRRSDLARSRETNKVLTLRARNEAGDDLVDVFTHFVDEKHFKIAA